MSQPDDTSPTISNPHAAPVSSSDSQWSPRLSSVGPYRLVDVLGRGGMGEVYEALDPAGRTVAVKLLPTSLADDTVACQRFLQEARAAAALRHPNTVGVLDIGRADDGRHYFVMELIRGGSAADFLRHRGPFNWPEATRIVAEACRGLAAAYAAAILHRDIKPANIMRSLTGEVKLADFGLAKTLSGDQVSMTATGMLVGTPAYMSPEQCRGWAMDFRSDVYSLGATYYALLTGQAPYASHNKDPMAVMFAHCSELVPDPRRLQPEVPTACAAIVARAMAKSPDERYHSALAMLAELDGLLGGLTSQQSEQSAWRELLVAQESARRSPTRSPAAAPARSSSAGPAKSPRLSGSHTLTQTTRPSGNRGRSRSSASESVVVLTAVAMSVGLLVLGVMSWALWPSDSSDAPPKPTVGPTDKSSLAKPEPPEPSDETSPMSKPDPTPTPSDGDWPKPPYDYDHSDQPPPKLERPKTVATTKLGGLGVPIVEARLDRFGAETDSHGVAFSSDGRWLAVGAANGTATLYDWSTGKSVWTGPVLGNRADLLVFSPNARLLAVASIGSEHTTVVKLLSVADGKVFGDLTVSAGVLELSWSPDSRQIVVCCQNGRVAGWESANDSNWQQQPALAALSGPRAVAFLDNERLAVVPSRTRIELHKVLLKGTHKTQTRNTPYSLGGLTVSANRAVLASAWYFSPAIVVLDAATLEERTVLPGLEGYKLSTYRMALTTDGRRLAATGHYGQIRLWDTLTGRDAVELRGLYQAGRAVAFSPDGRVLVAATARGVRVWDLPPAPP